MNLNEFESTNSDLFVQTNIETRASLSTVTALHGASIFRISLTPRADQTS